MRSSCLFAPIRQSFFAVLFAAPWLMPAQVALVEHAPEIDGKVEGSIQQMAGENLRLDGAATITGDLLVPGTPGLRVNRLAVLGATVAGAGAVSPFRYTVTLNAGVRVGRLRLRTDPFPLPFVAPPARPTGRRDVELNRVRQTVGDFATLRDLEIREGFGAIALPPGAYGEFKVHGRNTLVLGSAGSGKPLVYSFQQLKLKPNVEVRLAGPVVLTLGDGLEAVSATLGNSAHPEWLELRFASGGLELGEGAQAYAHVVAPLGRVEVGNRAKLTGGIVASRLTVRRQGTLHLETAPVVNAPAGPAPLPFAAGFESAEGYAPGPLHGQQGWEVAGGTATIGTSAPAAEGEFSVDVGEGAEARRQLETPAALSGIIFLDLFVQPSAALPAEAGSLVSFGGARIGFLRDGSVGRVVIPTEADGVASWQPVGVTFGTDAPGRIGRWVRVTARVDFTQGVWDLWVDGNMAGADLTLPSAVGTPPPLAALVVGGAAASSSRFDAVYVGGENPLFADADHDGMDDAWETANALDPSLNDREGDRDGDGLSNLREYRLGLRADRRDSDGDGLSDDWELAHGLDPKTANPREADADHDGVPDADEFFLGTDPMNSDTDGDGLPDFWEAVNNLNPLSPAGADDDPDGDGLTNRQEFAAGTDPRDFFNGIEPVTTALGEGDAGADEALVMKVTHPDGTPWANAPVLFQVTDGARRISPTRGGPNFGFSADVRADSNGIARVYLEPLEP